MRLSIAALIALGVQTPLFSQVAPKLSLKLERIQGKGVSDHVVSVRVRVANISPQAVEVLFSVNPEFQYTFAVIGPGGRPAPPARDAEGHRRARGGASQVLLPLAPGQSESWGFCPLSDLVDFSRPGTYRITATRHFGAPLDETDSSNVLEVKVP